FVVEGQPLLLRDVGEPLLDECRDLGDVVEALPDDDRAGGSRLGLGARRRGRGRGVGAAPAVVGAAAGAVVGAAA
ncbi:MAG: hypothetical protein JO023_06510, partial [Chloroflexi bacterium]|nr:hypothetical protein [Chloroflexota bacterium]